MAPLISVSDSSQTYEFSFGISFKDNKMGYDEILDLPQVIANDTGKKIIVCIDEFQNINEYEDSLAFQRKLRAHWQKQTSVCYCLYGSKRHVFAGGNGICYWIFLMTIACHSINSGTFYFFTR